jgi:hypothetical protein
MGYDVWITRAKDWSQAESVPITIEEWLAYVHSDATMRFDGYAEAPLPDGSIFRLESPGLSVWTGYSQSDQESNTVWFDWSDGCVVVKNPDAEIIRKMHEVACRFGARVQGDGGGVLWC